VRNYDFAAKIRLCVPNRPWRGRVQVRRPIERGDRDLRRDVRSLQSRKDIDTSTVRTLAPLTVVCWHF